MSYSGFLSQKRMFDHENKYAKHVVLASYAANPMNDKNTQ